MEKIGVIFYNFNFKDIGEFFNWCNENQVEYVEIYSRYLVEELKKFINRYNIKISQVSAGNDFVQKKEEFEKQVKMVGQLCKKVKDFGCNQIRIDGGWPKEDIDSSNYKELILDGIKRVVDFAEKESVFLALDNHGIITNDYQLQLEIFEKIKSKYLGANLDTMNYRWYGYPVEKLVEIYKLIAPYALHTHIKDGVGSRENYVGKVLGEGEVPVVEAIKILMENSYKGVWCIEYEGKDKEVGYKKCVEFLKKLKI
ncbi:MAG: sugar phosphate isomerase/epimerase [Candidatus Omnitrophica bacterium]|nr:sugar phosphate isomerase/epimerase [Candidatus Omnitrophota bacterium]MCM8803340.1 sugar phosphate isomerase/epimerase [Candidatus Omnitrophota bacterium]